MDVRKVKDGHRQWTTDYIDYLLFCYFRIQSLIHFLFVSFLEKDYRSSTKTIRNVLVDTDTNPSSNKKKVFT